MSLIAGIVCFVAGVWAEANFDLSGRALHLWRRWQSFRKGP